MKKLYVLFDGKDNDDKEASVLATTDSLREAKMIDRQFPHGSVWYLYHEDDRGDLTLVAEMVDGVRI